MNNFEINFDDGESMVVEGACNLHPLSHFKLPAGTTAQRPASPAVGMIRFNTEELQVEVWNGSSWLQIVRASAGGNNGSTPATEQQMFKNLWTQVLLQMVTTI